MQLSAAAVLLLAWLMLSLHPADVHAQERTVLAAASVDHLDGSSTAASALSLDAATARGVHAEDLAAALLSGLVPGSSNNNRRRKHGGRHGRHSHKHNKGTLPDFYSSRNTQYNYLTAAAMRQPITAVQTAGSNFRTTTTTTPVSTLSAAAAPPRSSAGQRLRAAAGARIPQLAPQPPLSELMRTASTAVGQQQLQQLQRLQYSSNNNNNKKGSAVSLVMKQPQDRVDVQIQQQHQTLLGKQIPADDDDGDDYDGDDYDARLLMHGSSGQQSLVDIDDGAAVGVTADQQQQSQQSDSDQRQYKKKKKQDTTRRLDQPDSSGDADDYNDDHHVNLMDYEHSSSSSKSSKSKSKSSAVVGRKSLTRVSKSKEEKYPGSQSSQVAGGSSSSSSSSSKHACRQTIIEEEEVGVVFDASKDKTTVTTLMGTCANPTHPAATLGGGCVVECEDDNDLAHLTPLNSHVMVAPASFEISTNYFPVMCSYRADVALRGTCSIVMKVACCSDVPKASTKAAKRDRSRPTLQGGGSGQSLLPVKQGSLDNNNDDDDGQQKEQEEEGEQYFAIIKSRLLRIPLEYEQPE